MNWFRTWLVSITRKPKVHTWLIRLARDIGLHGTLDSEAALRAKNHLIIELEKALAERERPVIYIHTTAPLRAVSPGAPQTTGPFRVESIRQRARDAQLKRQLNSQPSGTLLKLDTDMRHRKQITGQLDVETMRLPAMPKPGGPVTRDARTLPGA